MQIKKTAVLIVDMQKNVMANAYARSEVIKNIQTLVSQARLENVPVIWVQHSNEEMPFNSDGWKYIDELPRKEGEALVHKIYGDSFEATDLLSILEKQNIKRLVVAGAQTDACIRATLHGSFVRGFDTVLVGDAHTTEDLSAYGLPVPKALIDFTNTYWTWQAGPGRLATVVKTAEVQLV